MRDVTECYILVYGNPIDGLTFRGPFENRDDAIAYGERVGEADWWIAELAAPSDPA